MSVSVLRRMGLLPATGWLPRGRRKVVMHDLAKSQRQVAQNVHNRDNLKDRQLGDWRHGMRAERQRGRAGPRAFDRDVLEIVPDHLANARTAVDMRGWSPPN